MAAQLQHHIPLAPDLPRQDPLPPFPFQDLNTKCRCGSEASANSRTCLECTRAANSQEPRDKTYLEFLNRVVYLRGQLLRIRRRTYPHIATITVDTQSMCYNINLQRQPPGIVQDPLEGLREAQVPATHTALLEQAILLAYECSNCQGYLLPLIQHTLIQDPSSPVQTVEEIQLQFSLHRVLHMRVWGHRILKCTLKDGRIYAVDFTGSQFSCWKLVQDYGLYLSQNPATNIVNRGDLGCMYQIMRQFVQATYATDQHIYFAYKVPYSMLRDQTPPWFVPLRLTDEERTKAEWIFAVDLAEEISHLRANSVAQPALGAGAIH